ncbi:hypothetical protein [Nocardioides kribbensis]|uniref:Uncharacterized protein n=1 Tax=Nocardioides kribbensis TaxID=305517 RepID=A0ABV1NTL0_9ACTN
MTAPLVLRLAPGDAFGGSDFVFRASEDHAADLTSTLQQAGFDAEIPISHGSGGQQGVEILVTLVKAAGGVDGLAKILATYLARHDKKSVVLPDGTSLQGYGTNEVTKILSALREFNQPTVPPDTQ